MGVFHCFVSSFLYQRVSQSSLNEPTPGIHIRWIQEAIKPSISDTQITQQRGVISGKPELAHFLESLRNCQQKLYKNLFRRVETC